MVNGIVKSYYMENNKFQITNKLNYMKECNLFIYINNFIYERIWVIIMY